MKLNASQWEALRETAAGAPRWSDGNATKTLRSLQKRGLVKRVYEEPFYLITEAGRAALAERAR